MISEYTDQSPKHKKWYKMYDFDLIFVLNLTEMTHSKLDVKAKKNRAPPVW